MLLIRHILKNSVEINSPFRFLYGFKLQSGMEKYIPLSQRVIDLMLKRSLAKKNIADQIFFFAFYRKKIRNTNAYLNELYLFTYSKEFAKFVLEHIPSFKLLSGVELANVIYRLHTLDDDIIVEKKKIKRTAEIFKKDLEKFPPIENLYKNLVKNAFEKKDLVGYVGASLEDLEVVDYTNLLITDWEGVLWITFHIADFTNFLTGKEMRAIGEDKLRWKEIKEKYKTKLHLVGFEAFLIGERRKLTTDKAISLMSFIGFTPKEKKAGIDKLLSETPLKYFDTDYEFVDLTSYVRKLIPVSLEKYRLAKEPLFAGINRFNTYVNYSPFEDCSSPHTLTIAPTGSGKSVFLCEQTKNALGIDIDQIIKVATKPKTENVYIRYFDKGYTAELFFKLLELRGLNVFRFSLNPNEIKINPCEIQDETTDFDFSVQHISTILKSLNLPPLKGGEIIVYTTALKEIYKNDKYKYVLTLNVRDLKELAPKIYKRLKKEGWKDDTPLMEVVKSDPKKYWYINQPILSDVIRFLANQKEYGTIFENKEDIENTLTKLKVVRNIDQFSFLSEIDIKNAPIIYMDLDPLSSSQYFTPIVMGILKRIFHFDKYKKPADTKAYYFFDEAHTLLRYEEFAKALEIAVREARKFKISLNFATQNWKEIPPQIILNICTRYFLTPKSEKGEESIESRRLEILREYANHIGLTLEDIKDLKDIYISLGSYFIATLTDQGIFSLKIPPTPTDLMLFKAENPYFLLENDKVALIREKRIDNETKKELEEKGYILF